MFCARRLRVAFVITGAVACALLVSFERGARAQLDPTGARTSHGKVIKGTGRNDNLVGTRYADRISGGKGNDRITGLAGNDSLDGGPGKDTVTASITLNRDVYGAWSRRAEKLEAERFKGHSLSEVARTDDAPAARQVGYLQRRTVFPRLELFRREQ